MIHNHQINATNKNESTNTNISTRIDVCPSGFFPMSDEDESSATLTPILKSVVETQKQQQEKFLHLAERETKLNKVKLSADTIPFISHASKIQTLMKDAELANITHQQEQQFIQQQQQLQSHYFQLQQEQQQQQSTEAYYRNEQNVYEIDPITEQVKKTDKAIKNNEMNCGASVSYVSIFRESFYKLLYIFRIYGKPSAVALVNNVEGNIVYSMKLNSSFQLELFPGILSAMLQDPMIHIKRFYIPAGYDEIEIYFEFGSESCFKRVLLYFDGKKTYFPLRKVFSSRPISPEFIIGNGVTKDEKVSSSGTNDITIISFSPRGSWKEEKIKNSCSSFEDFTVAITENFILLDV